MNALDLKIAQSIVSRSVVADEHNPDPISLKAFLTEFKRGEQTGAEGAISGDDPVSLPNRISAAEDLVATAALDLATLGKRMEVIAQRGNLGINEHRLAAKVSGILSTLFYNAGKARGLKGA